MNKQEIIEKIKEMTVETFLSGTLFVKQKEVIKLIEQLDEPQKPVVPQFVAEWIEVCKENIAIGLYTALNPDFIKQYNKSNELIAWVRKHKNQEVFARAWIFGYEVEKEKRYLVKMKNILDGDSFLNLSNTTEIWFWGDKKDTEYVRTYHTRKELEEAGFGWVFDCEGMEVEEVEE